MKVNIDIDVYFSNPFIAIDSVDFDEINPFLDANGKENLSGLDAWKTFCLRVALRLRGAEIENIHIEETKQSHDSTSRSALIFASNNDKSVEMEILIKPILSDHNYAVDCDTYGNFNSYSVGKQNYVITTEVDCKYIDLADVILISEELGMMDLYRSFTEVIRNLLDIVSKMRGNV